MAECRFFPECARCNEVGDSWFPCEGGADGTRCADYAPMPDVDALLKLAKHLDAEAECRIKRNDLIARRSDRSRNMAIAKDFSGIAYEIRKALGVES